MYYEVIIIFFTVYPSDDSDDKLPDLEDDTELGKFFEIINYFIVLHVMHRKSFNAVNI